MFYVEEDLKDYHESTKGRKHEKENGQTFVSSYFRAFVVNFVFGSGLSGLGSMFR